MEMDKSLTHINERGEMNIVDISDKVETKREALAEGYIYLNKDAIINSIKEKALEAVTGSLGDTLGDSLPIPDTTGGVIPELPKSPF